MLKISNAAREILGGFRHNPLANFNAFNIFLCFEHILVKERLILGDAQDVQVKLG